MNDTPSDVQTKLTVRIFSASFREPMPADDSGHGGGFVFDCRALPNPGREPRFAELTGTHPEVRAFLEERSEVEEFYLHARALAGQLVENFLQRGFETLMVSFACTGGQHRSVYLADRLAQDLGGAYPISIEIRHLGRAGRMNS